MAPRKQAKKGQQNGADGAALTAQPSQSNSKALVFISHDSRDADLAEAFSNLLLDVSGGMLKSFRSSDKKGASGIDFGEEWYAAIISQLADATDVVALLSQQSIDRPWILYEAGLAKGRLETTVIGVALGVPLSQVVTGPFGQFQNCADDEDSQTKLVMQLLKRNPDATPREEAIKYQVRTFRDRIATILKERGKLPAQIPPTSEQSAAKLFEEIKAMLRELPERVDERTRFSDRRKPFKRMRRLNPLLLDGVVFNPEQMGSPNGAAATSLLILMSMIRDDFPWIYEAGMELYRAMRNRSGSQISRTARDLQSIVRFTTSPPLIYDFVDDKEAFHILRSLDPMINRIVTTVRPMRETSVDTDAVPQSEPIEKKDGAQ